MPYQIHYTPVAVTHLQELTARQRRIVLDAVLANLSHEPQVPTKHRKPLRPNPIAPWELRLGNMRVYYDVIEEPPPTVVILAVGVKSRNQVRIGGKVIEL